MFESIRWLFPNLIEPTWTDVIVVITLIIIGWLIQKYVIKYLIKKIVTFLENKSKLMSARIIEHFSVEIQHAFLTWVIFFSMSYLIEVSLFSHASMKSLFYSLMVFYLFKGIYDVIAYYSNQPEAFHVDVNKSTKLTPFILRIINALLVIVAIIVIASLWNFNLNGFLTGIGLTSVAIAFGVRDTSSHIFGGLSMTFDKPFQIGDYITTEDQKVEGVILDINLRSTLITTADKGVVYVPNAYLMNRPIYNLSKREKWKIQSYYHIAASHTEEEVRAICTEINKQIILHPKTSNLDTILVYVDEFHAEYYRLLISFYIPSNDIHEKYEVQQDILFVVKQIMDQYQIQIVDSNNQNEELLVSNH